MNESEANQEVMNKNLVKQTDKHDSQIEKIRKSIVNQDDSIKSVHQKNGMLKSDIGKIYKYIDGQMIDSRQKLEYVKDDFKDRIADIDKDYQETICEL